MPDRQSPYLRDGIDRKGGNTGHAVAVEVPAGEVPGTRSRRTARLAPIPAAVFPDSRWITHQLAIEISGAAVEFSDPIKLRRTIAVNVEDVATARVTSLSRFPATGLAKRRRRKPCRRWVFAVLFLTLSRKFCIKLPLLQEDQSSEFSARARSQDIDRAQESRLHRASSS